MVARRMGAVNNLHTAIGSGTTDVRMISVRVATELAAVDRDIRAAHHR